MRVFKPVIFLGIIKFIQLGEPEMLDGRPAIKKGRTWFWESPIGVHIEIFK